VAVHRCVCPGSFDPVTSGHVDVMRRATALFDEVVVAVVTNPSKQPLFSLPERLEMLAEALAGLARVRIEVLEAGLLVDFCSAQQAVAVVRGVRSAGDYGYELPMALMNRHLSGVETVFLPGDPRFEHVSSRLVKEVAGYGGDVSGLVPDPVLDRLTRRLAGASSLRPPTTRPSTTRPSTTRPTTGDGGT
jgi:pantetheine-phosphate adenylyltransferase